MSVEVTIQYAEGCSHLDATYELVAEILESSGSHGVLKTLLVSSVEDAENLRFLGSPTVLVDGEDPCFDPNAPVGLACRLYASADTASGVPPREKLQQALMESQQRQSQSL